MGAAIGTHLAPLSQRARATRLEELLAREVDSRFCRERWSAEELAVAVYCAGLISARARTGPLAIEAASGEQRVKIAHIGVELWIVRIFQGSAG